MASSALLRRVVGVLITVVTISTCYLPVPCLSMKGNKTLLQGKCNILQGKWVFDEQSSPAYNSTSCPFVRSRFDCQSNGRPDTSYLKFRWKPNGCNLPRLNARDFLRRFRGKKIMFVGDSLILNQWQSLTCLLHAAVPQSNYTLTQIDPSIPYVFHIPEYNVSIMMQWNQLLVEMEEGEEGIALRLDHIMGDEWMGIDLLIFHSYGWWFQRKPKQSWDYMEVEGKTYRDLNRTVAFNIGLQNWAKWIDQNIDHNKTKVFFQGFSPAHYRGKDWGEPKQKGCEASTTAVQDKGNRLPESPGIGIVKSVLSRMKHPAHFLDISHISLLRPDAHCGVYTSPAHGAADCTHWCLPGVPDTWNHLLYALVKS